METFEAIRTLLAVRQYRDEPIPDEVAREIVEAAQLTGSSINGQPWYFIVVRDKAMLRQLGQLARTGPYIAEAPMAVVVCMTQSPYNISDASRAVQSMMLAAWSRGVGSNWVGFNNLEAVKAPLGIPAEVSALAIVPFGYPAREIGQGRKNRKPLGEVAFSERFGQPFA